MNCRHTIPVVIIIILVMSRCSACCIRGYIPIPHPTSLWRSNGEMSFTCAYLPPKIGKMIDCSPDSCGESPTCYGVVFFFFFFFFFLSPSEFCTVSRSQGIQYSSSPVDRSSTYWYGWEAIRLASNSTRDKRLSTNLYDCRGPLWVDR
jgi:hypothetical protein